MRDNVAAKVSKTLNKRQCQHWQTKILTKHFSAHLCECLARTRALSRSLSLCIVSVSCFWFEPKSRKKKSAQLNCALSQTGCQSVTHSLSPPPCLSIRLVTQARTQHANPQPNRKSKTQTQTQNSNTNTNRNPKTFGFCTLSFLAHSLDKWSVINAALKGAQSAQIEPTTPSPRAAYHILPLC